MKRLVLLLTGLVCLGLSGSLSAQTFNYNSNPLFNVSPNVRFNFSNFNGTFSVNYPGIFTPIPAFTVTNNRTIVGNGLTADPNNRTRLLVRAAGGNNNIGHSELGTYGDIFGGGKWLAIGSGPAGIGASVYGKRIQWNSNFAVFNLREVNATTRDLVIQWGGTTSNNRLRFEYATGPTAAATTAMQIESNGNVGIGITPSGTDKLRVNGRIRFGSVEYIEDGGANTMTSQGSIVPSVNNSRDLGNATFRWDDVFATNGVIQTSDRREKDNIRKAEYGIAEVMALRPVTYTWKKQKEKGTQIGLIAQEVNKILPEIVYDPAEDRVLNEEGQLVPIEDKEARMGINYALFTPVLVQAIQDQQAQLEEQRAMIEEQAALIAELQAGTSSANKTSADVLDAQPELFQNAPNPFSAETKIKFFLPETVQNATLNIYDMQGSPVLDVQISERGQAAYTLDGNLLSNGMYLYSLIADGKEVGVKRMILTK